MAWNLKNRFIELCKAMKLKKLFLHMLYFLGRIPVRIFQRTQKIEGNDDGPWWF